MFAALKAHLERENLAIASGDKGRAIALSAEFHVLIADLAEQPILAGFVRELVSRSSLVVALYWRRSDATCERHAHHELVEAIAAERCRACRRPDAQPPGRHPLRPRPPPAADERRGAVETAALAAVGWAKARVAPCPRVTRKNRPTRNRVGTALTRLCPPYDAKKSRLLCLVKCVLLNTTTKHRRTLWEGPRLGNAKSENSAPIDGPERCAPPVRSVPVPRLAHLMGGFFMRKLLTLATALSAAALVSAASVGTAQRGRPAHAVLGGVGPGQRAGRARPRTSPPRPASR